MILADGSIEFFHGEGKVTAYDELGNPCLMTGIDQDITDRKRTEEELRRTEELFRSSVENMPGCLGVYSAVRDREGRITDFKVEYVNEAACVNNNMSREEQVGKNLLDLLPAHVTTGLFDEYVRLVESGETLVKESLTYSDTYNGKPLTRAFDIRVAKLGDGFVASRFDVTERTKTEEALRLSEEQFRRAIEEAPIPVIMQAEDGRVLQISRS